MNTLSSLDRLEYRKLLSVAREYRHQGYEVTLYPDCAHLPVSLSGCQLGLIAEGAQKTIAVSVRTKENLTLNGAKDLRRIATQMSRLPNWEFELVVTNPRPRSS